MVKNVVNKGAITNTHASHAWPVVPQVREEIEFENLAKMYLREMIKRECWDEMVVKGRAVQVRTCCLQIYL